jgi:hypothetical protein
MLGASTGRETNARLIGSSCSTLDSPQSLYRKTLAVADALAVPRSPNLESRCLDSPVFLVSSAGRPPADGGDSPKEFSAAAREMLTRAIGLYCVAPDGAPADAELGRLLREASQVARAHHVPAERVLIVLKQLWAEHPMVERIDAWEERDRSWTHLITLVLNHYFAGAAPPPDTPDKW